MTTPSGLAPLLPLLLSGCLSVADPAPPLRAERNGGQSGTGAGVGGGTFPGGGTAGSWPGESGAGGAAGEGSGNGGAAESGGTGAGAPGGTGAQASGGSAGTPSGGTGGSPACIPKTCADLGADCGFIPDGCGDVVSCGNCPAGTICGGSAPNLCGTLPCSPKTCANLGASCGYASDGCGKSIYCGSCPSGQTCGAGNACSCVKKTCSSNQCGTISDGCGGSVYCGGCPSGQTCGSGNLCSCVKKSCGTGQCGTLSDGCGGTLSCGSCPVGEACGAGGVANQCACTPYTGWTEWRSPSAVGNDSSQSGNAWSNPSWVESSDDLRAQVSVSYPGTYTSQYLEATGFGFSLPASATVKGIEVQIERYRTGTVNDLKVRLIKSGSFTGSKSALWPISDAYTDYGASNQDWGTSWTASQIDSSGFGVVLAVSCMTGLPSACSGTAYVDHVRVRVYYVSNC